MHQAPRRDNIPFDQLQLVQLAPVDEGVVAERQKTADVLFQTDALRTRVKAADLVDPRVTDSHQ